MATLSLRNAVWFISAVFFLALLSDASHTVSSQKMDLLNAYRSPLSAMTAPNNFYFLEFPLDQGSATNGPVCGDGSPYSFAFRRGSDAHMRKLIVEIEGGPACYHWGRDETPLWIDGNVTLESETLCSCQTGSRQSPWSNYIETDQQAVVSNGFFPPLGYCRGIPEGLIRFGGEQLLSENSEDLPLGVRSPGTEGNKKWWEHLDDNIHDWSYLLLPHCTLDWNLGQQDSAQAPADENCEGGHFFRGGRNIQAAIDWVNSQFSPEGGVEALITLPIGRLGGCSSDDTGHGSILGNVAPILLAQGVAITQPDVSSRKLVILEGSHLLKDTLPSVETFQDLWDADKSIPRSSSATGGSDMIQDLIRDTDASFAWFGGRPQSLDELESISTWLAQVIADKRQNFHLFEQKDLDEILFGFTLSDDCPMYTFPDDQVSASGNVKKFIQKVVRTMAWSSKSSSSQADFVENRSNDVDGFRLTFLTILMMSIAIYAIAWIVYWSIARYRAKRGIDGRPLPSPHDLWLSALTEHPRLFLLVSLAIPLLLSFLGIQKSGYSIQMNLDFDTYLTIETDLETISRSVKAYRRYQDDSNDIENDNCKILDEGMGARRNLFKEDWENSLGTTSPMLKDPFDIPPTAYHFQREEHRDLQYELYWGTGPLITLIYQNRNGGNVFEPEVLREIRDFEQAIYDFPGYDEYCLNLGFRCLPFDSVVPQFFPAGWLTNNINGVLRTFLGDQTSLWKVDQFFGPDNLASNITRSFVWIRDGDVDETNMFLKRLYNDLLWKADQDKRYPNLLFTWENSYLTELEANEAVSHDALWASGSFIFIGIMIFLKVRNGFVFLAGVLGLGLSFLTAYYWCLIHFDIPEITLLHVSSLFVMMGIGADDIFLMVDSFEHTQFIMQGEEERIQEAENNGEDNHVLSGERVESEFSLNEHTSGATFNVDEVQKQVKNVDPFGIIRQRMRMAYQTAGSMMLVSSLTTAICFFSNAFAVVTVIKEFGIYMGMVVLINFVHVMTILPSAILVNEIYLVPLRRKYVISRWCRNRAKSNSLKTVRQTSNLELDIPSEDGLFDESMRPDAATKDAEDPSESLSSDGSESGDTNRAASWKNLVERYNHQDDAETKSDENNHDPDDGTVESHQHMKDERVLSSDRSEDEKDHETVKQGNKDLSSASELGRMDRWLVKQYSPFLIRRRFHIMFILMLLALVLGILGVLSFEVSDGTIILFSEKYNLGRLTPLLDTYFDSDLSQSIERDDITAPSPQNGDDGNEIDDTSNNNDNNSPIGGSPGGNSSGGSSVGDSTSGGSSGGSNVGVGGSSGGSTGGGTNNAPTVAPNGPNNEDSAPAVAPVASPDLGGSPSPGSSSGGGTGSGGGVSPPTGGIPDNLPNCSGLCQNGGICNFSGVCTCLDGWTGGVCSIPICPTSSSDGVCMGNGDCMPHPNGVPGSSLCQCFDGYSGYDCSVTTIVGNDAPLLRKQSIVVSLVWGAERLDERPDLWVIHGKYEAPSETDGNNDNEAQSFAIERGLDVSDPTFQQWMLDVVKRARNTTNLFVETGSPTWIEIVETASVEQGIGFPVPKDVFPGFIQLLKENNRLFAALIRDEIGTTAPGLAGDFLFASITLLGEVKGSVKSLSSDTYTAWSGFVETINAEAPQSIPAVVAQSRTFLNAHRSEETISSTATSWLLANLLCLIIILGFTRSLRLSLMVMTTIILIFLCLAGLLFGILVLPFGPVEALGVSIFIGLSANYNLHVVHAYQHSTEKRREDKVKSAIFGIGSPIIASALSTIGGCLFLFGCRTYVFIELGILICSITTFALVFSMSFLPAWLSVMGPVSSSIEDNRTTLASATGLWEACKRFVAQCKEIPHRLSSTEQEGDALNS